MARAYGKPPKRSATKLFGSRGKRLSKEERQQKFMDGRKRWQLPAGATPARRDRSLEVRRAPKVPPPTHEPTGRQASIASMKALRDECIAIQAKTLAEEAEKKAIVAKCKAEVNALFFRTLLFAETQVPA
jgi:hypothetical protein